MCLIEILILGKLNKIVRLKFHTRVLENKKKFEAGDIKLIMRNTYTLSERHSFVVLP